MFEVTRVSCLIVLYFSVFRCMDAFKAVFSPVRSVYPINIYDQDVYVLCQSVIFSSPESKASGELIV